MDKRILTSLIVASFFMCCYSQEKELIIKDIRSKFKEINSYQIYKKIKLDNEEFMKQMTDGGGQLTAYLKTIRFIKYTRGLAYHLESEKLNTTIGKRIYSLPIKRRRFSIIYFI